MSRLRRSVLFGLTLALGGALTEVDAQMAIHTDLTPRIVHRGDGERRYLTGGRFMLLKVGPVATGASYLFMGYEDMPPGSAIPEHSHEVDEEVIIIHRGRVQVVLGHDTATAVAGDAIFLPPRNHISIRALAPDTASIFFVFPRGTVERCFQGSGRAAPDAPPPSYTDAEMAEGRRVCQMTYY
jgi:quercetin dioxygenase-like cupin family protein